MLPIVANEWPGAQKDQQSQLMADIEEARKIVIAGEVEHAFFGFVIVPRNIGSDCVDPCALGFEKPVAP